MKDLVKRAILTAIAGVLSSGMAGAQAQTECESSYAIFLENRKGPDIATLKKAVTSGKEYLAKCGTVEGQEAIREYITKNVPKIEEAIRVKELEMRFDAAVPAKNWTETLSSGKELIAINHPATLDIMIVAASIGYASLASNDPADTYADQGLVFADQVLNRLNAGKTSENYGAHQFRYKTKACADGKANTASWMNYTIGSIKYKRYKQAREAFPYLIKASQEGCELKDYPEIYRLIGAWYIEEAVKISVAREEKIKAAGDQETDETRASLALLKGYTERAMDAYARAFKAASARPEITSAYRDALYKKLLDLFESRYDGNVQGVDQFAAGVMSKPFPDPTSTVTPVIETTSVQAAVPPVTTPKKP